MSIKFYTIEKLYYAMFNMPFKDEYFEKIMEKGDWTYIINLTICIGTILSTADKYNFVDFMRLHLSPEQQNQVNDKIKNGIIDVETKYGLYNNTKSAMN
jgi:hypothetical protein